ncbi:hypothetical protein ACFPOI_47060 [Nonomuraea angiospora]|uniref:Uncharacterized protein n=1 Tax=Nonomuraea angiospora TaxID=46172 RepID=A0ABR9LZ91_9ACTN|nr:hypothetical protein [Nonomuraea angiospora]MBE1585613.1 hypothetical protein [Nonomuraea angiospora]
MKARARAGALDGPAAHVRVRSGGPLWLAAGEPAPPGMVRLTRPDSTGQALPVWPDGVTPSLLEEYQVAPVPVERSGETRRVLAAVLKCCWTDLSVDPWPGEPAPVELVLDTYRALIGRTDDLMRNWAIGAMRRLHDSAWIVVDDGVVTLGPRCALWPVESHAQLQELVRRLPEPERPELTVVGDADIVAAAHPAAPAPDPEAAGLGGRVEGGSAEFDDLLGAYDERRRAELVAAFMVVEHAAEPVQEVRFAALRDPALRHTVSEMLARRGRTLIQHRDRWTSGYDDTQAAALAKSASETASEAAHKGTHEIPRKATHEAPHDDRHESSRKITHDAPQESSHKTTHDASHDDPHDSSRKTSSEAPRKAADDGGRGATHGLPGEAANGASAGAGPTPAESLPATGAALGGAAGAAVAGKASAGITGEVRPAVGGDVRAAVAREARTAVGGEARAAVGGEASTADGAEARAADGGEAGTAVRRESREGIGGEAGEAVERANGDEPVAARAVAPGVRPVVPAGARLGVSERAVLTLVLVHSVAIPRAEGLLPEDSWLSPHPTPVDELRRHTQLPIGELEAALRTLRHAGLLGQVKAGEEAGGYVPGPQFHRLTPAARRRLQEELILAAGPNTPLAAAVRSRRSTK